MAIYQLTFFASDSNVSGSVPLIGEALHSYKRFGILQEIVMDHGKHFQNHMMTELASKLELSHENSTPYYPLDNRQFEAIKKVLKSMLQRMIGVHKLDWHLLLFASLWACRT